MADAVTLHLCVLWEDELREAARALRALEGVKQDTPEWSRVLVEGYRACQVALYGLTDDKVAVMVGNAAIRGTAKRARKGKTKPPRGSGV